ncbi:alpha/beta hydrolase [Tritonibacter mobilis]|nr:alpha/beta hydrolase [Tritonibacter mobilis]
MAETAPAPYFSEIARGPDQVEAHWLTTQDGQRIRAGLWRSDGPSAGTILLFPGRTEYIEKYGPLAIDLTVRGFDVLTVDWRGQGLADRSLSDGRLGHVAEFGAFQLDVAALVAHAEALDLPRPWYLLGHSMGGAIGLRALHEGLPVAACAFTAPMWAIRIPFALRPAARLLARFGTALGVSEKLVPTTTIEQYVQVTPFEGNTLTNDPEMYAFLQMQMTQHPELALGGPTVQWLSQAMLECADLRPRPSPDVPCVTFLGENEQIVATEAIHDRMARWPSGKLEMIPDAQHEILMEIPQTRRQTCDSLTEHFKKHV